MFSNIDQPLFPNFPWLFLPMVFDIFGNINGPEVWAMKYGLWRKIYEGTRRAQVSLSHSCHRCIRRPEDDGTATHLGNGDPQRFHPGREIPRAMEALVPHFS